MSCVVYGLGFAVKNNLICLVMQILVGCVIYIGLSVITKNDSYIYLKKCFFSKIIKKAGTRI
jgi:hypothetical protein